MGEFSSLSEFLQMGGYAFYLWACYGLTAIVLVGNVIWARFTRKKLENEIRQGLAMMKAQGGNHASGA